LTEYRGELGSFCWTTTSLEFSISLVRSSFVKKDASATVGDLSTTIHVKVKADDFILHLTIFLWGSFLKWRGRFVGGRCRSSWFRVLYCQLLHLGTCYCRLWNSKSEKVGFNKAMGSYKKHPTTENVR
jgi:hypothetical protein